MIITRKKHRRNLSYEDAATLSEFWEMAAQFDRSLVAAKGRLPYCESPEEYVCRMETRKEILAVLALCTEEQRERFLLHALYDFSYEEVGRICGCSKGAVEKSIKSVKKIFQNVGKRVYVRHFKMAIR